MFLVLPYMRLGCTPFCPPSVPLVELLRLLCWGGSLTRNLLQAPAAQIPSIEDPDVKPRQDKTRERKDNVESQTPDLNFDTVRCAEGSQQPCGLTGMITEAGISDEM